MRWKVRLVAFLGRLAWAEYSSEDQSGVWSRPHYPAGDESLLPSEPPPSVAERRFSSIRFRTAYGLNVALARNACVKPNGGVVLFPAPGGDTLLPDRLLEQLFSQVITHSEAMMILAHLDLVQMYGPVLDSLLNTSSLLLCLCTIITPIPTFLVIP